MKVVSLSVSKVRNLKLSDVGFHEGFNLVYGENAQGKSSLLESLHILCTSVSYRTRLVSDVISWGSEEGYVSGEINVNGYIHSVSVLLSRYRSKEVTVDGERIKASTLFKMFPVTVISRDTRNLLRSGHEVRRKFIDYILFRTDQYYLDFYYGYIKLLKSKNYVLRQRDKGQERLVSSLNHQLSEYGNRLIELRSALIKEINTIISRFSSFSVEYIPSMSNRLDSLMDIEFSRGYAICGPHRDKIYIMHRGRPLEKYGSSGQRELCIIFLKIAELELLRQHYMYYPLFIIDDVDLMMISKKSISIFIDYLRSIDIQIAVATVYPDMWLKDAHYIHVVSGHIV